MITITTESSTTYLTNRSVQFDSSFFISIDNEYLTRYYVIYIALNLFRNLHLYVSQLSVLLGDEHF